MPSQRGTSIPPAPPSGGLGASRWATQDLPGLEASRFAASATRPAKPAGGLGTSRFTGSSAGTNPFYNGPFDPRHRDPTAVVLETSTGSLQADSVSGTYQTWHRVEDTGSKIIFHLDEINCLVRGVVKSKNGASNNTENTVTQATANLSIVLDKNMVFGQNQEFVVTDKGYFLEDGSVLKLNTEGDGRPGRAPALGVGISKMKDVDPDQAEKTTSNKASFEKLFVPTSKDIIIDLGRTNKTLQEHSEKLFAQPDTPLTMQPLSSLEVTKSSNNIDDPASICCVVVTGLPYGFKVKQVLDLITPTKNTLVTEIKLTKSCSAILCFISPEGARDFLSQYPVGYVCFPYEDDDLGMVEWRSKISLWGRHVPTKPEGVRDHVIRHGATRFLRIRGRNPTTLREANQVWTIDQYNNGIGGYVYDGHVYRDDCDYEVADLEFLAIHRAIGAISTLKPKDGFAHATFTFLPDKYVLT